MTTFSTFATATYANGNIVVVQSAENMIPGLPITFAGNTFGNLTTNATYYIGNITFGFPTSNITLTSLPGGAIYSIANGSGNMVTTFSQGGQQIIPTVPPGEPLNVAFDAINVNFDQIFAAGPVGSNIQIDENTIYTLNTNGNLVLNPNGIGNVIANAHVIPDQDRVRNLGAPAVRWNTIYAQNIVGNIAGNIVAGGANGDIQFNNDGILGGANGFTYNNATNSVSVSGNLTAANVAAGNIVASGTAYLYNISSGGVSSLTTIQAATLSASGNITGNYFFGNGSQLTGIDATSIQNGNSNVRVVSAGGNVAIGVGGTSNVVVIANTGQFVNGIVSATGGFYGDIYTTLIDSGDSSAILVIPDVIMSASLTVNQDLQVDNQITAVGNITGNYFFGNGSLLTGIITSVSNINNGTSNVTIGNPNGNVTMGVAGVNNVMVVSPTDVTINGNLTVSGNATLSGNILGDRIQNGNTQIDIQTAGGNANVTVGGVSNVAVFTTTGLFVTGLANVSGNITGNYFFGNGSQLTGITADNVNADDLVGNTLSGNVLFSSLTSVGTLSNLSVAGTVTVGNISIPSSGNVLLGNVNLNNLANPVANSDAATKFYVDSVAANVLPIITNQTITPNGSANTFVLDQSTTAVGILVTINGVTQTPTVDYTVTGNSITIGETPLSSDIIQVRYLSGTTTGGGGGSNYANANVVAYAESGWGGNIIPQGNLVYNLGNSTNRWNDLYLSGNTIYLDNATIGANGEDVVFSGNINLSTNGYINFDAGGIRQTLNEDFYIRASDDESDGWSIYNIIDDGAGNTLTQTRLEYNQFSVRTDVQGAFPYTWQFRDSGLLEIPGDIAGNVGGNLTIKIGDQAGSDTFIDLQTRSYVGDALISNIRIANPNVTISTAAGANTWTFGADGTLALPYGATLRDTAGNSVVFGLNAGANAQGTDSVAIGTNAGNTGQERHNVAIGTEAGMNNQGEDSVAIGWLAGRDDQTRFGIAIGWGAGANTQGQYAQAYGRNAGAYYQQSDAIAIGESAGRYLQKQEAIAIGYASGFGGTYGEVVVSMQASNIVRLNSNTGLYPGMTVVGGSLTPGNGITISSLIGGEDIVLSGDPPSPLDPGDNLNFYPAQGPGAIAIGSQAAQTLQGQNAIAVGYQAGRLRQGSYSIAIGEDSGQTEQGIEAVAIGRGAGNVTQANTATAVGSYAGNNGQGIASVAMGFRAGYTGQGNSSVALGEEAGYQDQGINAVAVGYRAGNNGQGIASVAMGFNAGYTGQGNSSVALGEEAGYTGQGQNSIAIGRSAGQSSQGNAAIAMGWAAAQTTQGNAAVAIGEDAGRYYQGEYSIALGYQAGYNSQGNNSIVLNATGGQINGANANTFTVKPIRSDTTGNVLYYDESSGEITFGVGGGAANTGNVTFSDQIVIGTGISNLISGLYLSPSSSSANAVQYLRVRGDVTYEPTHIHFDTGNNQYFNQFIGDDNKYVLLSNIGDIVIRTDDNAGNSAQWTFGADGNLTIPGNILGGGNILIAPDSANSDGCLDIYLTTGPDVHVASNGDSNLILGRDNYANVTVNQNGNVSVQASTGSSPSVWTFDTTGNLSAPGNISATGNVTGGNLVTAGSGGNITLTGGNITGANVVTANAVSTTGNVTAANFFGNGNTLSNVATTFESTWTVPVGNSTQSFTVNSGTYSMWVEGNIPNGIIVWNATGTVTNTNVPVVGYQYAWVYNGGGTPIDFTSIPNQFIGTANTIVRSNVAPSSTTNRFDFGINNTSGGNVTVRYGWVQIS